MTADIYEATADEPRSAHWSGGWSDCETCGGNSEYAEFSWDGEQWYGTLSVGCFSGDSVYSTEWDDIQEWLDNWKHLDKGWKKFSKYVKQLFEEGHE